jgi:hypothetical protein
MELIIKLESSGFPPRLQGQPIFYPVLNLEYAIQIAKEWNTKDMNSGFVGFVTQFGIDEDYVSKFEEKTVGSVVHQELWIPAEELQNFNNKIITKIDIIDAFYGMGYEGPVPERTNLKNKNVIEQFCILSNLISYSGMDFRCEVSSQWQLVLLNYKFWIDTDFSSFGIFEEQKQKTLQSISELWKENHSDLNLICAE